MSNNPTSNRWRDESIETIEALNDKPKFLIFHADLITPFAIIIGLTYFIAQMLLSLSFPIFGAIAIWLCSGWWMLAGDKSYEFTDKFFLLPGKAYFNLNSTFIPATQKLFKDKMSAKIRPTWRETVGGKKEKIVPFQIESDLHAIMEVDFGEDNFGVLLRCNQNNEWSATIPFELEGIHTELYDSEVTSCSQALSDALGDIPYGETLTLMLGCRSRVRQRIDALRKLEAINKLPLISLMLASDELRTKEITKKGFRQEWSQYALVSWSQSKQKLRKKNDISTRFINSISNIFEAKSSAFAGTSGDRQYDIYSTIAKDIYKNSFTSWKNTLGTKAKLKFRPLSPQKIWEDLLWYKFNSGEPPEIPQLIVVSRTGKELNSQVKVSNSKNPKDTLSVLLEGERGRSSCPQHYERRDLIAVNNELVGVMALERPPKRWLDHRDQLKWIWSKMSDVTVRDTEVFLQISKGDRQKSQEKLVKISKQSTHSNAYAIQQGEGLSVAATIKQDEALEAQRRLHLGGTPLYMAMTVLVYRQDIEELNHACDRLANSFSPANLIREERISWRLWIETLPINSRLLLKSVPSFSERRPILDNISGVGLLPITKPKNIHDDGFELIDEQGGYPVHINLFKHNERAIVTGKSGSGKSVMAAGIIRHALALGVKVVGIDMSNAGESTFELITNLLGDRGSYINIIERSFNLLQPPDLSNFDDLVMKDSRLRIWQNSLRSVLVSLAMGQIDDRELYERVDSITVRLLNTFFADQTIVDRYNLAFEGGWRSQAWQNIPVLKDLLFFCSREKLGINDYEEIDARAIGQITNQIGAKLIDPNIGKAISRPSDIPTDPDLKFFALSGLNNDSNSYVMALVAQMACLNTSLESPKSLLVMDECSVLLSKHGFAEIVGERFATGRKEGQSVLIIGQDIEAIANCSANSKITTNTDYWLIGKTTSNSLPTYIKELNIPPHIISRNASEAYRPNEQYMFSHWLLRRDDRYWNTLYFPSAIDLAVLANSPDEKDVRAKILEHYPPTPIGVLEGVAEFGKHLWKAYSSGSSIRDLELKDIKKYVHR